MPPRSISDSVDLPKLIETSPFSEIFVAPAHSSAHPQRNTHAGTQHITHAALSTCSDKKESPLFIGTAIDDKTLYTRPWKMSFPLYRRIEKNVQLLEFKCVPFTEQMLYGRFSK